MNTPRTLSPLLGLLFFALLAGCNGEEDFSDAILGATGVKGGVNNDPFDPTGVVVEVELVAALFDADVGDAVPAVISNLGYKCGGIVNRIPKAGNAAGFEPHRARCPVSSTRIEYFIGEADEPGQFIDLGVAYLPKCSNRDVDVSGNTCTNGPGFFQFGLGDLTVSPARLPGTDTEAAYRAALLVTIDEDEETTGIIEIPDGAHSVTEAVQNFPPALFDADLYATPGDASANYADFQSQWQPWLSSVELVTADDYSFPALADAQAYATLGANRVRSGLWAIFHNTPTVLGPSYAVAFRDELGEGQAYEDYGKATLLMDTVIFPGGEILGLGVTQSLESGDTELVAISGQQTVSETMYLGGAPGADLTVRGLFSPVDTELDLSARIFSVAAYDGLEIDNNNGGVSIDFEVDYPVLEAYPGGGTIDSLDPNDDVARMSGVVLGETLGPVGFQAQRAGIIAPNLDVETQPFFPQFYQLTIMQACVEDSQPGCLVIPTAERGLNYPQSINGRSVTEERGRSDLFGAGGSVNVEFLESGYIVTDVDADCSAVDPVTLQDGDGDTQEYLVGFVTRTDYEEVDDPENEGEVIVAAASANVLLYFVGDPALTGGATALAPTPPFIPQYGTLVSGRLDLLDQIGDVPLYRLSDTRFFDRIRATWQDLYQPAKFVRDNDPLDEVQQREQKALASGAVVGKVVVQDESTLESDCVVRSEAPPAP